MKTLPAALALPALLALVGCVTEESSSLPDDGSPSDPNVPGPKPTFTPASCQEILDRTPAATDGEVTLYVQNQASLPWQAYCADMQGTPREYLTLSATGANANTSMYATGNADVVTHYERVRIDPATLIIDISDQAFTVSTGSLLYKGMTVSSMPFGVALTCGGTASANIDLTGTPFRAEDAFPVAGTGMVGTWDLSTDRKALDVSVSGADCGHVGPALTPGDPINAAGASVLRLAYAG